MLPSPTLASFKQLCDQPLLSCYPPESWSQATLALVTRMAVWSSMEDCHVVRRVQNKGNPENRGRWLGAQYIWCWRKPWKWGRGRHCSWPCGSMHISSFLSTTSWLPPWCLDTSDGLRWWTPRWKLIGQFWACRRSLLVFAQKIIEENKKKAASYIEFLYLTLHGGEQGLEWDWLCEPQSVSESQRFHYDALGLSALWECTVAAGQL